MIGHVYQIHPNDRAAQAKQLGLSPREFDRLIKSANDAFSIMTELGPFYGREEIKEPTFRMTAEPVKFSKEIKEQLIHLGDDIFYMARALHLLPDSSKAMLGKEVEYTIPPTWRIDA